MTNITNARLQRWLLLALLFPLIFLNGWLLVQVLSFFQPLVTIFTVAALLACVLNYAVRFLLNKGLQRNSAILLVSLVTVTILVGLGGILIPILVEQLGQFTRLIPSWVDAANQRLDNLQSWLLAHHLPVNLSRIVDQLTDRLPTDLEDVGDRAVTLLVETIGGVSEVVLTAVITLYLLIDGERLWIRLFQKFPPQIANPVRQSLQQNFQNYFSAQVTLSTVVWVMMSLVLLILQVPFALLLALGWGILSLFPFGDTISLLIVTSITIAHNFWQGILVLVVGILLDQVIDQGIAPRLLGHLTGLRPLSIIGALLIGAKLGGLLGLMVAIPIASFIKDAIDGFPSYVEEVQALAPEFIPDQNGTTSTPPEVLEQV